MVSQSQTGQLLDILERIGAGSSGQVSLTEEIDSSKEQQCLQQESEVDTTIASNEPHTDNPELSTEDTAELFSLCQEIQDLVDGPGNTINETDLDVVSLISELPVEVSKTVQKPINQTIKPSDELSEIFSLLDSDSGFGSDDERTDFSPSNAIDDDFLDLFPILSSV